jgi:hypothetical protein
MTTAIELLSVLTTSSVTISWSINNLGTQNLSGLADAVVSVGWTISGEQLKDTGSTATYVATRSGTIAIVPDLAHFIPYDQLTQNQIVAWVNKELGHTRTQDLIKQIIADIAVQQNPVVTKALPW